MLAAPENGFRLVEKTLISKQPLEITRVENNELVAKLKWNKKPKQTTVEGLLGHDGVVEVQGKLMFKE